jgi:hypothetical protein
MDVLTLMINGSVDLINIYIYFFFKKKQSGIPTNGQSAAMRTINLGGRNFALAGANNNMVQINGIRPLTGNGLVNTAAINAARHQLATNGNSTNLRQVSNGAAIPNLCYPNGFNVLANNGANFGHTNLNQMRPMMRTVLNGGVLNNLGYDLILPSQSPRQNNVSPSSVSTSNGGNNSVGTPSPQPQAEQRTVR